MNSRIAKVLLVGVLAAGLSGAAAATLGGLTGGSLGSDDQVVASCDTDGITTGYTTSYVASAQEYRVSAVNFTGVNAACNAKAASVTLRNGTTALNTTNVASIAVTGGAFSVTLGTAVPASSVNGLSVVISG